MTFSVLPPLFLMPILRFLAHFVLLPFFLAFQWHCWQQEELQTVWISCSSMGNCDGGREHWALVLLLGQPWQTGQKEELRERERGVKMQSCQGLLPACFLQLNRASSRDTSVLQCSFPYRLVISRRFSAWDLLWKHSIQTEHLDKISSVSVGCNPTLLLLFYFTYYVPEI